jgi:hypothetical protein
MISFSSAKRAPKLVAFSSASIMVRNTKAAFMWTLVRVAIRAHPVDRHTARHSRRCQDSNGMKRRPPRAILKQHRCEPHRLVHATSQTSKLKRLPRPS